MSDGSASGQRTIVVRSSRFGDLTVPEDTVIELPNGLIGFPSHTKFVMIDHKPPFSWLHSIDDSNLAFVVVDGFQFGDNYLIEVPVGDKDIDLLTDDEYAILVIVTVRAAPEATTANLKAPVIVNIRNRKGAQLIFDNPRYSTRFPLWSKEQEGDAGEAGKGEKSSVE